MAKKRFKVASGEPKVAPVVQKTTDDEEPKVAVSLRYWHTSSQCLSVWQKGELGGLRKLVDKVQALTSSKIRTDPGLLHKLHKAAPKGKGFSRPSALSKDIPLCELRVSQKARVHGALHENIFYLVWLDRNHDAFPDGK